MNYQAHQHTLKAIDLGALGSTESHPFGEGLDIRITPANGGTVVSVITSSPSGMLTKPNIYVISDKDDLGTELGKIITMVCLKQSS